MTYAEVLRGAGYRTLWVGKSGLGWVDNSGAPWRLGFDYFYGQPDQAGCHDMYPVGYNGTDPAAAGRPTVEIVTRRGLIPNPSTSPTAASARSKWSRLASGSPIPITTM